MHPPCMHPILLANFQWGMSAQGVPLDAESIAAGIVADCVASGQLPLDLVEERLGGVAGLLVRDMLKVTSCLCLVSLT